MRFSHTLQVHRLFKDRVRGLIDVGMREGNDELRLDGREDCLGVFRKDLLDFGYDFALVGVVLAVVGQSSQLLCERLHRLDLGTQLA